jgi:hypothetical protein
MFFFKRGKQCSRIYLKRTERVVVNKVSSSIGGKGVIKKVSFSMSDKGRGQKVNISMVRRGIVK